MKLFEDVVQHYIYRGVERPIALGYDYVLAGNGLFKRAEKSSIRACVWLVRRRVRGLPDMKAEVVVKTGLIGGHLLQMVLEDAKEKAVAGQEQSYLFRVQERQIKVTRPSQEASAARVEAWTEQGYDDVLCDLHSHNSMAATFSSTDDGDEKGFRFYAVIGRVLERPEILVRLGVYGDMIYVPAKLLFADLGGIEDRFTTHLQGRKRGDTA